MDVDTLPTAAILDRLVCWAEADERIRALILEGSRAGNSVSIDQVSDYDVLVVVTDVTGFAADEQWLSAFDRPLVRFNDHDVEGGLHTFMRLVLYADGTKIDYCLWPVAMLERIIASAELPDILDTGYAVLLDKDQRAGRLPPPMYRAHVPAPPSQAAYDALVEEFWWETIYVAKNLWRDELMQARYSFESVLKLELLRRLLEWRIELNHDWALRPGRWGRHMKERLDAATWRELAATYVGADLEANWDALFRMTALFRRIALEVGTALGYAYQQQRDDEVTRYLQQVRQLDRSVGAR